MIQSQIEIKKFIQMYEKDSDQSLDLLQDAIQMQYNPGLAEGESKQSLLRHEVDIVDYILNSQKRKSSNNNSSNKTANNKTHSA